MMLDIEATEVLEGVLGCVPELVVVVAPDTTIKAASSSFVGAVGLSDGDIAGVRLADVQHLDDLKNALIKKIRESTGSREFFFSECVDASGTPAHYSCTLSPVKRSGAILHYVAVARDVTESKRLDETRQKYLEIALHDIKNPLHAIKLNAGLIRKFSSERFMIDAANSIDTSVNVVNFLLSEYAAGAALNNFSDGSMSVSDVSCSDLVMEVYKIMRPIAEQKGVKLGISCEPDGIKTSCDRYKVLQLLQNLVSNAIKFTPKNGTVVLSCSSSDKEVVFDVTDSGPGIKRENVDNVFRPYWKENPKSLEGVGLGLTIARNIARAHNGRLTLAYTGSNGSRFEFAIAKS